MIWLVLGIIPLGLLIAMFGTRNAMLGFPATMFWAIFGGYAYTQSSTPWGDWQYYVAFGSLLGMTTFSAFAAYGLRERRDTLGDEAMEREPAGIMDEKGNQEDIAFHSDGDEVVSSERSRRLQERVARRRSKSARKGEFSF